MVSAAKFLVWPLLAFALSGCLHVIAIKFFPPWGFLDFPDRYGLTRPQLPYPTGIIAVLVFLVLFVILNPWNTLNVGLAIGILLLALTSFIDDRTPLSPGLRIGIQLAVAALLFLSGARIYSVTNPLAGIIGGNVIDLSRGIVALPFFGTVPLLSGLFTLLWLGLTINALNWFDGIPGQVSVISTIGFLTIGLLSLSSRVHEPTIASLALILAGITSGCAVFEIPTPKVLMGDTGAMFFGLMIGALTIYAGQGKVATAFLVLGVPLIDFAIVIARRIRKGKSPLAGDKSRNEHLHHRLLAKGWSAMQIILLTTGLGTAFGITALFLSTAGKFIAAGILFVIMLGLSWYSRPFTAHSPPPVSL